MPRTPAPPLPDEEVLEQLLEFALTAIDAAASEWRTSDHFDWLGDPEARRKTKAREKEVEYVRDRGRQLVREMKRRLGEAP